MDSSNHSNSAWQDVIDAADQRCAGIRRLGAGHVLERVYAYQAVNGGAGFFNARYVPLNGGQKTFRRVVLDDGAFRIARTGEPQDPHLPFLHDTWARPGPLLICEGEQDALTAISLGYAATNGKRLTADHYALITGRGARLVIVADNDDAGKRQAAALHERHPGAVIWFPMPLVSGGDLTDLVRELGADGMDEEAIRDELDLRMTQGSEDATSEDARRAADDAKPARLPALSTFEALDMNPRTFLWRPHIPDAGYLLFAGRGQAGKTTLAIAMHAWASVGTFPGHQRAPVRSLIIEKQDSDGDEIKPKLIANGYDQRMVLRLTDKRTMPSLDELEALIVEHRLGMVTLSPFNSFVGQSVKSLNDDQEIEPLLDRVHDIGVRNNCLISGVKHLNKKPDLSGDQRVAGAGGFVNSARTIVMVAMDSGTGVRLAELIKTSRSVEHRWRMEFVDTGLDARPDNPTAFVKVVLSDAEATDSIDTMLAARSTLSEPQEEVLDFFAGRRGDFGYKEIAKELGRKEATTKTQLNRMANRGLISRGDCEGTFRRLQKKSGS